ncbi:MAG: hypothetical protein ACD_69C00068G0003 [uncultured bacterium]|nr:MAG: hypothetical protein ACD_69C00068G0003 [uncultured bacterium]
MGNGGMLQKIWVDLCQSRADIVAWIVKTAATSLRAKARVI